MAAKETSKGLTWTIADADHMTQAEIYGEVLTKLGEKNEKIVALTADLAGSTKIGKFQDKFPERFFNLGIAENNMFALASGMAAAGMLPVVSTFAVFAALRSAEFVRTDICYQKRNIKIIATHSGTSFGQAGTTHHCTEDLGVMRTFANMTVIAPADAFETAKSVAAALETDGPVYIRIGRSFEPPLHENLDFDFEIGKAITLHEGTDVTVIVAGRPALGALEAAEIAGRNNVTMRVLDMHTIKPIDEEAILKAVTETRRIITVEDHNIFGGLGSAVAEVISKSGKACAMRRIGLNDEYSIVGYPDDLLHYYKMDADGILETMQELLEAEIEEDEDWEDEY
ncbi:transketolase family protein [Thermodesulfobacteriota bacterium]